MMKNDWGRFFFKLLKFIPPLLLWAFLFKSFILGKAVIVGEGFGQYTEIKYYLDNLRTGVFPLWNPILYWGFPTHISLSTFALNPIWLITLVFSNLGISYYDSFIYTYIISFFVGLIGFYLLAKTILQNRFAAYAAFLLLTFSSLTIPLFVQQIGFLIFLPSVWFFYFLLRFCQKWEKRFFAGMIFSVMMVFSEYLPFYFFTIFFLVVFLFMILYPKGIKRILSGFWGFFRTHLFLVIFCLMALALSLFPGMRAYQSTVNHEVVIPTRHWAQGESDVFKQGATLTYGNTSGGEISRWMSVEDLFSNLDHIKYGNDSFFYVSLFAYLVAVLGAFVRMNRRIVLLFFLTLSLFLLIAGNISPVHPFLFKHTSYFKLFRNLQFLMPAMLAACLLMVSGQLKLLLEHKEKGRWGWLGCLVLTHLGFWFFLTRQENIIQSSYATIILSFIFFIFVFFNKERINRYILPVLLMACVLVQPAEVLWYHNKKADRFGSGLIKKSLEIPPSKLHFAYDRSVAPPVDGTQEDLANQFYWYSLSMTDSPGFVTHRERDGTPSYWSFYIFQNIPKEVFWKYTRNKFYLYDQIKIIKDEHSNLDDITNAFGNNANLAFVSLEKVDPPVTELSFFMKDLRAAQSKRATIITGPSEDFNVTYFDANSLKIETNYVEEKFLVYNDSFQNDWQAFRSGERVPLYRANLGFKGIRLPAGHNKVYLRYRPFGGVYIYYCVLTGFAGVFALLIFLFYQSFKQENIS